MSDQGNPEQGPMPERFMIDELQGATHLADGSKVVFSEALLSGVSPEEAREIQAKAYGIDPSDIIINSYNGQPYDDISTPKARKAARASVAFSASRWNSSWDPKAPKPDPNNN